VKNIPIGNYLYIDVETTGLDPLRHGVHQLAVLFVIDGEIVDRVGYRIAPYQSCQFDPKALEISGVSEEKIACGDSERIVMRDLSYRLRRVRYGTKTRSDRWSPVGYNVGFDMGFFKELVMRTDMFRYSDLMTHRQVDVLQLVRNMQAAGMIGSKSAKLSDICAEFGVELDAHDAMNDIEATFVLHRKLLNIIRGGTQ